MAKIILIMDIEKKNEAARNAVRRLQKFHEWMAGYKKEEQ